MDLPNRKSLRLKNYDYSKTNAYFLTICAQNRLNLFAEFKNTQITYNSAGKMIEEKLLKVSANEDITVDKYCVMPKHLHVIILITRTGTTQGSFPTVSELVQRFKTITTKLYIDGVKSGEYPPFDK